MKTLLLSFTALAAAAGTAPAVAQSPSWSGVDVRNRIDALDNRLEAGVRAGVVTRLEEARLRDQIDDLERLERQYSYGGFTAVERDDLRQRLTTLREDIRMADNGRFDRDSRFAWADDDRLDRRGGAMSSADFRDRIYRLEMRLNAGIRSGDVTRSEELGLRRQLSDLRRLERQYSYNGLSWDEQRDLQTRLRTARQNINFADSGRFDRDHRYSWADDGFYGNRYMGRGGPIEAVDACQDRGLSAVVNSLIGRSCFRVGDQVTRNLYAVPYQFRDQYRDAPGVYYRYDGNLVYAIDPSTNRVISSFDID